MSGYFEIGIWKVKRNHNVGTLWRSAYQLGAAGIFTIAGRYRRQVSDTLNVDANIPLRQYADIDEFGIGRPHGAQLIGVEMGGEPLETFAHPARAVYLLGAEDHGLAPDILAMCQHVVSIGSIRQASYNVAMAGTIVMYHRYMSRLRGEQ